MGRDSHEVLGRGGVSALAQLTAAKQDSSSSLNGLQRAATLSYTFNDTGKSFNRRQGKISAANDNQNGRVTIVKKLQKYSEIILDIGKDQHRGSFPLRGSSMQTGQASNLPMLSKTYLTANLMDLSSQPVVASDGHDPLQHEKGSPIDNIYDSKLSPAIPLKRKAPKLTKQLAPNLTLSKLTKKNLDTTSLKFGNEPGGLNSENIETRVRGSL